MVTGAAGSIGSELCRQVARFEPACLVVFDQAESDLFRIENELREKYPDLELVTALGDIRDSRPAGGGVRSASRWRCVFHAAAYKHVPMMESHVLEAVRNNVLGTWNLVRAARQPERAQSADDLLRQSGESDLRDGRHQARLRTDRLRAAGRGGGRPNVFRCASAMCWAATAAWCPIFQAQIAAGGPVKVTHPEARRYFMTISEAVSLVVQASTKSEGSEIFVLDMGEPIRIVDLAENMIRLAGKVPYEDIDIQFTGLRPGEKLIEEINGKSEGLLAHFHGEDACDSRTASGLGQDRRLDR